MNPEKFGFCDGLLGRKCQSPTQWPDFEQYLIHYLQGKEYRVENGVNLTFEEMTK